MRQLIIVLVSLLSLPLFAQRLHTEHTWKLGEGTKQAAASIGEMEWLAGRWIGEGLGGVSEEVWSSPRGGVMMGMYRLIKDGQPVFYEFITLVESGGSLVMRIKHFHADMKAWEEKEKTVDFPYLGTRDGAFFFSGLTFKPEGKKMTVWLALRGKDGTLREETFTLRR